MNRPNISKDSTVTIGSAIAICAVLLTLAWRQAAWQSTLEAAVTTNTAKLTELGQTITDAGPNSWSKTDQRHFSTELQELNTSLVVPRIHNSFDRTQ